MTSSQRQLARAFPARISSRTLGASALAGLLFAASHLPAVHAEADTTAASDEKVVLSPFTVSASGDGYSVQQIVSATRIATDIKELPMSISIITEQFLDDLAAIDIQDVVAYQNVTTVGTDYFESNISSSFVARGFNAATMRNGFVAAGGSTPTSTIAVDRVEVVKGAQSLLYGEMDPGGLINIVSKRPSAKPGTRIRETVGPYRTSTTKFDSTGPLTKDGRFTYRLLGLYGNGGAIAAGTQIERRELVGMLGGDLTSTTHVNLEFDFVHHHNDAPPSGAFYYQLGSDPAGRGNLVEFVVPGYGAPGPDFNYRGHGDYGDGIERYLYAEVLQRAGTWNLRAAFGALWDGSSRITRKGPAPITTTNGSLTDTWGASTSESQTLQVDATRMWQFRGLTWKFLAGANAVHGRTSQGSAQSSVTYGKWNPLVPSTWPQPWAPPAPDLSTFTKAMSRSGSTFKDAAVYTTNMFGLFENRLHFLEGMRYQRVNATVTNTLPNPNNQDFRLSQTSYQSGVVYDVTKHISAYFGWSESFNPQNRILRQKKPIDPATGLPVVDSANSTDPALPVKGEGHDIGIKADFFNGRLHTSLAYYSLRRSNVIQTRVINDPATGNEVDTYDVQSGAEGSKGLEFGLNGRPYKGVDVMIAYTLPFEGKLLSDATHPTYVGKELQNNPKHQLNYFVKYTVQGGRLGGAYLGAGGRYWSAFQSYQPTQPTVSTLPGFNMMEAVGGYRLRLGRVLYSIQINVTICSIVRPCWASIGSPARGRLAPRLAPSSNLA